MANRHLSYTEFKNRFGDLGITEWTKYNWLSNYNFGLPTQTIPLEYTELDYIVKNGDQQVYVDTDWFVDWNKSFEIESKVMPLENVSDSNRIAILSNYDCNATLSLELRGSNQAQAYLSNDLNPITATNTIVINEINNIKLTYEPTVGGTLTANASSTNYQLSRNLVANKSALLFIDRENRFSVFDANHRFYNLTIKVDGKLIRDFVPAKRNSDGTVGLYDKITNMFYKNGTGTFEAGNMIQRYEKVLYVESTGSEYVDTELPGQAGYTLDTVASHTSFPNDYCYIAGFGDATNNRIYFTRLQKSSQTEGFTYLTAMNSTTTAALDTKYHYISVMKNGEQKLFRDDELILSSNITGTPSFGNIWLFTSNYADESNGASAIKLYSCKFYYEDELVRNFIPVLDKQTNKYQLYDLITQKVYESTGDLVGPV